MYALNRGCFRPCSSSVNIPTLFFSVLVSVSFFIFCRYLVLHISLVSLLWSLVTDSDFPASSCSYTYTHTKLASHLPVDTSSPLPSHFTLFIPRLSISSPPTIPPVPFPPLRLYKQSICPVTLCIQNPIYVRSNSCYLYGIMNLYVLTC